MYCTTDIELIGPHESASAGESPSAIAQVKVDANASPAPVRSTGSAGSGYMGICHATSFSSSTYAPSGPSVMTGSFGPSLRNARRRVGMCCSVVLRIS